MVRARRFVAAIVMLAVASLAGGCGGAPAPVKPPVKPFQIRMQNLIGLSRQAAERILRDDGVFDWAEPTKVSPSNPLGTVIAQSPAPGVLIGSSDVVITLAGRKNQP